MGGARGSWGVSDWLKDMRALAAEKGQRCESEWGMYMLSRCGVGPVCLAASESTYSLSHPAPHKSLTLLEVSYPADFTCIGMLVGKVLVYETDGSYDLMLDQGPFA